MLPPEPRNSPESQGAEVGAGTVQLEAEAADTGPSSLEAAAGSSQAAAADTCNHRVVAAAAGASSSLQPPDRPCVPSPTLR